MTATWCKNTVGLGKENSKLPARKGRWEKQQLRITLATPTLRLIASYISYAVSVGIALLYASSRDCAKAQNITLDGSLGPAQTLIGPNYLIPQAVGQTVGSNLFHSFGQFNLNAGESAGFQSAANIQNIFSRVTGGFPSLIDGLIFTQSPSVNLFLINPSGIVFGRNARLDVGSATKGSFVATTVDALVWPNGSQFSAINPGSPTSILTIVGDPSGFLASQRAPQPIVSSGSTLGVYEGQSLLLLGGDVTLNNSSLSVDLVKGGRIELGGVSGAGLVGLGVNGNELRLSFPDGVARADVSMNNRSAIFVDAEDGGSIAINARNFNMSGGSILNAGIAQGLGRVDSQAGDIDINTTGAVTLAASSIINLLNFQSVGNGGNINITTRSLSIINGGQLGATTLGQGNTGNVTINATDSVFLDGVGSNRTSSNISNSVAPGAVGNGGVINITTGSLSVTNGARLLVSTFGQGDAGSLRINARDTVFFDGVGSNGFPSAATSQVARGAMGNGGNIEITTGSLTLTNRAQLAASIFGNGNAGSVTINARDTVSFDGDSQVLTRVEPGAVGRAGSLNITAGSLSVTNGSRVSSSTNGQGDANNITITARDISFDGSEIFSTVGPEAEGNGGDIKITARSLFVTNGAQLGAATLGLGNAGNVTITATDLVSFNAADLINLVELGAVGKGGDIDITTGSLFVTNGAQLLASTLGQGDAGNVTITARDTVSFDGVDSNEFASAVLTAVEPEGQGNGGNIKITAQALLLTNSGFLRASTSGQGAGGNIILNVNTLSAFNSGGVLTTSFSAGKAGNITVNATDRVTLSGSGGLFANTAETSTAQGGDLKIMTSQLTVQDRAQVSVSSDGLGNAGNLRIEANSISLDNQGKLLASTASGEGGNIELQVQDLILMRHASLISAQANNNGNGGNITISTPFIVAVPGENSDIIANAFRGQGGNINITTQGIYGLEYRQELTPLSDINASSRFGVNGTVQINTPGIDPSRGLTNLPTEVVDASDQIAQNCPTGGATASQQNEFIVTGRGGLPDNPNETLSSDAIWTDLRLTPRQTQTRSSSQDTKEQPSVSSRQDVRRLEAQGKASLTMPANSRTVPLLEAQGWVINDKGQVVLTVSAPTTPQNLGLTPATCPRS